MSDVHGLHGSGRVRVNPVSLRDKIVWGLSIYLLFLATLAAVVEFSPLFVP